ncbi:CU044_2847 family protein [Streptomyces silvisoli]|uniref:CU044_2847 family protein n=1 Tax=Streptomyces silvisoli TaxID=3034235 RepID=A0ABT5ZRW6_9ACTN|nr:CU044_2847 family protein [Streptomyces silvisoli]MDF3292552.1 CU044_2847 family protein [Streptomyces silvisoli]
MPQYAEIQLDPDTSVRLELAPVGVLQQPTAADDAGSDAADLPDGIAGSAPVGRAGAAVSALTSEALRFSLRPLGPLLQEVHDSVSAIKNPPQEISVEFGVQIGQDLKLGIVGARGHASLMVTASWQVGQDSE